MRETQGNSRDINVWQSGAGHAVPFESAEEAWFWFIRAQQARNDGARFVAGAGLYPRPCEPSDILNALNRLYRGRRLLMDHLLVLRHYGRRQLPPDPARVKELRAHTLWREALGRLGEILERKGIVSERANRGSPDWPEAAQLYEGMAAE